MTKTKWVYSFGAKRTEGDAGMRDTLGGKGANLAEMSKLGLPVPPGFTITTQACLAFFEKKGAYPDGLAKEITAALKRIEKETGGRFGAQDKTLLLSVRSGARASMPGMMDTILNLGLNDETTEALAAHTKNPRFAYDSYRRFVQMYGNVVMGVPHNLFEDNLELYKQEVGKLEDAELSADDLRAILALYKETIAETTGSDFPTDAHTQLNAAINAVFGSWHNERARTYRRLHAIPDDWGTAVNVQAMVFGNMGETSATGVAFTRDPSTGEKRFYGEFLLNAQGEDVVAGLRTPAPLTRETARAQGTSAAPMEEVMPECFAELSRIRDILERHYRDMQDLEFTIQEGRLWMLQTRAGKRSAAASVRIAVEMVAEKRLTREEALLRVEPETLDRLLHPTLDPKAPRDVLTKGLPASPGAASGEVVFAPGAAEAIAQQGRKVILVRTETSPEDIHGMHAAEGILTARGGTTSHAAVVARGMGRPCVAGAGDVVIDEGARHFSVGTRRVAQGEVITIDGTTGEVILGKVARLQPTLSPAFETLMRWADDARRLRVRANAETPTDAQTASNFGAEGIGLARTEHMFFDAARISAVREMILATDSETRRHALARLLPMQRSDFVELFQIMGARPVTIRLLDPPLHEFLPKASEIDATARELNISADALRLRITQMHETNPMLGHRGCRLGITYPEIYEMQTRAILEAAGEVSAKQGTPVIPEIMLPLIAMESELAFLKKRIEGVADEMGVKPDAYKLGVMIELPRAVLRADALAEDAEFFSFGTNDLTQTVFGISRDDAARFLAAYAEMDFFERNPFVSIDEAGVGALMREGVAKARATRADIKLGICGEHGGDPASIAFCDALGLDYVSCSPYRVPIARLAAAQASLKRKKAKR